MCMNILSFFGIDFHQWALLLKMLLHHGNLDLECRKIFMYFGHEFLL